ncbi:hypothetical protein EDD85DRAFT_941788 [Armillaria nabsnona]|nr:hypothetical protein EDD85DRAFT_941788 [Armillaria nabsnona]
MGLIEWSRDRVGYFYGNRAELLVTIRVYLLFNLYVYLAIQILHSAGLNMNVEKILRIYLIFWTYSWRAGAGLFYQLVPKVLKRATQKLHVVFVSLESSHDSRLVLAEDDLPFWH